MSDVMGGDVGRWRIGRAVAGIVLAGRHDSGTDPVSGFVRRPLIEVAQTPHIGYSLGWLHDAGVRSVVISGGSSTGELRTYLRNGAEIGLSLQYQQEDHPRGPAGCVRDAMSLVDATTFVVVEASLIPVLDLVAVLSAHFRSGASVTSVVERERRKLTETGDLRQPGGVYVFERSVLERVPARGFHDIKQGLLDRLHRDRVDVHAYEVEGLTARIRDFASYSSVSRWLCGCADMLARFRPDLEPFDGGFCHPSVDIHSSARFVGPVVIGEGVRIERDAVIVGPTSISAGASVGASAVVSRSVMLGRSSIGTRGRVDSSLLAEGVALPDVCDVSHEVVLPDSELSVGRNIVSAKGTSKHRTLAALRHAKA